MNLESSITSRLPDVRNIGHLGTGDLELRVKTAADVNKAFPLIQRSYAVS
ncbi:hypothetical protein ABZ897_01210 [Nonomuraea sp. NPDC046802]